MFAQELWRLGTRLPDQVRGAGRARAHKGRGMPRYSLPEVSLGDGKSGCSAPWCPRPNLVFFHFQSGRLSKNTQRHHPTTARF